MNPSSERIHTPLRALVVDDSRTEQKIATLALRAAGCETTVTGSAREALLALGESTYAFVLTDQQLPDLAGASLVGLVNREFEAPPPMAMWSSDPAAADAASRAGAVAFVQKPARPATLTALASQHQRLPAQASHQPLLDERQLHDSVLTVPSGDEARMFVGRWQAEVTTLLEQAVCASTTHAPEDAQRALHRLLGCASLTGARRLAELVVALQERPEDLRLPVTVQQALEVTQASARALLLRTTLLGRGTSA